MLPFVTCRDIATPCGQTFEIIVRSGELFVCNGRTRPHCGVFSSSVVLFGPGAAGFFGRGYHGISSG